MLLYEGKAKRVFKTEDPTVLKIEYKDEVTAGNGMRHDYLKGKGRLNNLISSKVFEYIKEKGIHSHFITKTSETEQLVKPVSIIPLEVVVRNFAAGSISKRLGLEKGIEFTPSFVEFYYKNDNLNDPIVTEDHIRALNIATEDEIIVLKENALALNDVLVEMMLKMNLKLVDFKVEFGKDDNGNILLADEISPDTSRIWDLNTNENFDKDVYRENTGSIVEVYEKFYNKLEEL